MIDSGQRPSDSSAAARVAAVLAPCAFLSLFTNRLPALTAGLLLLATVACIPRARETPRLLLLVWGWWIASLLLSLQFSGTFADSAFHRRDGLIFFSLLPLAVFSATRLDPRAYGRVLGAFCAGQGLIALAGLAGAALGAKAFLDGAVYLDDENRGMLHFCALYRAHNAAGSVLALCCVVAATLAVFLREKRPRLFWAACTLPLLGGVILSKSRGSMLALGVALVVLGFLAWRRRALSRRAWVSIGVAVLVTSVIAGPNVVRRFGQFLDARGTHTDRLEWWKRGLTEWSWSPVVGIGMGRYNDTDREFSGVKHLFYVATDGTVVNSAGHAHNSYIHFLAEGGLVGLVVTVGFWGWLAWRLRRSREPLRIAAFLGILFLFAISMTEHYMGGGIMLMVLSCIVGAAWNLPEPESGGEPEPDDPGSTKDDPSGTLAPQ